MNRVEAVPLPLPAETQTRRRTFAPEAAHFMVPLQLLYCALAAIGITTLYVAWRRWQLARPMGPDQRLRERVAYMLWVAATKG